MTATADSAACLEVSTEVAREIATTIQKQIGAGVLMCLGAHDLAFDRTGPALTFKAVILPMLASGKRSAEPSTMRVTVTLNALDYYDVKVVYEAHGETVTHFERKDVDCFELPVLLLALDYDGAEVLNPRYAA